METAPSNNEASSGTSALDDGLGVIPRELWEGRYASRIMERAGWPSALALNAAKIGADEYERNEHAAGNAVVWWGGPSGANNTPEDEADEEISYWTDDGE